jgi:hypothetical protein
MDFAGSGTFPSGGHRMADPGVRVRTFVMLLVLVAFAWGAVKLLDRPACAAFNGQETRELAGLPIPPECVSDRIPPGGPFSQSGVTP